MKRPKAHTHTHKKKKKKEKNTEKKGAMWSAGAEEQTRVNKKIAN